MRFTMWFIYELWRVERGSGGQGRFKRWGLRTAQAFDSPVAARLWIMQNEEGFEPDLDFDNYFIHFFEGEPPAELKSQF